MLHKLVLAAAVIAVSASAQAGKTLDTIKQRDQLLAHPTLVTSRDQALKSLADALPPGLRGEADAVMAAAAGELIVRQGQLLMVLPLVGIQNAPSDRVATAVVETIFPGYGSTVMAVAIMISTFGCVNALVLTGARAYHAMAHDNLFFRVPRN